MLAGEKAFEDIVLNAVHDATAGPDAGAVYVVYGPADVTSLADATIQQQFANLGAEPVGSTPAVFGAFAAAEIPI